jgi:hypothetical protein
MNSARVALLAAVVALVVAALGFFLARGLHPPVKTPATPASGGAHAADLGTHGRAPAPRPDVDGGGGGGPPSHARVILSAPWGSAPGQLGRRNDPESVTEGPMSFFVDGHGVVILDNVNRRIARFDAHGRPLPPIALDTDAAQDLARARDRLATLDRLHDKRVTLYDADGTTRATLPLAAAGITEPAAVTGLFGDRDGALWVEVEHTERLRLADANGVADSARTPVPGRPLRAGGWASAQIVDRNAGRARIQYFSSVDGPPAWQATVDFGAPLMFLALLDGDAAGRVYLGAHTGSESTAPPYAIVDEALTLVALTPAGSEAGRLTLPAPPPREESFRDLYVGDDGTIYWMRRTAAGVVVEAYRL